MGKKIWTDEEKKAFGIKMKALREAKKKERAEKKPEQKIEEVVEGRIVKEDKEFVEVKGEEVEIEVPIPDKEIPQKKKPATKYRIIDSFGIRRKVDDVVTNTQHCPGEPVPDDLSEVKKEELFVQRKLAKLNSSGELSFYRTKKELSRGEVIALAENPVNIVSYLQQFKIDGDSLNSLIFELNKVNDNPIYVRLIEKELKNGEKEKDIPAK